jgi:hypothetical protein
MERLVNNFNIYEDFWECNPNLRLIKQFKAIYDNEKVNEKGNSQKRRQKGLLMWAVALLVDKHPDNPYKNLTEQDRRILIKEDYLKDDTFDWGTVEGLIDTYRTFCLSPVDRALTQIEKKIDERDKLIANTEYTIANADDLDKLILKTKAIKDFYKEMKAEAEQEQTNDGITRGGRQESMSEKGLI